MMIADKKRLGIRSSECVHRPQLGGKDIHEKRCRKDCKGPSQKEGNYDIKTSFDVKLWPRVAHLNREGDSSKGAERKSGRKEGVKNNLCAGLPTKAHSRRGQGSPNLKRQRGRFYIT